MLVVLFGAPLPLPLDTISTILARVCTLLRTKRKRPDGRDVLVRSFYFSMTDWVE